MSDPDQNIRPQPSSRLGESTSVSLDEIDRHSQEGSSDLDRVSELDIDNDSSRQGRLQYTDQMAEACRKITNDNYAGQERLLKELLDSPYDQWTLSTGREMNPIKILFGKIEKVPQAEQLAGHVIDFYAKMAKEKKDIRFVDPIVELLPEIVEPRKSRPDIVLKALRGLAFIPTEKAITDLDRCVIAIPRKSLWEWWWDKEKPSNSHVRDVFVASFDMLWTPPGLFSQLLMPDWPNVLLYMPYWFNTLLFIISFPLIFIPKVDAIKIHGYTREMLDNPAFAALIEYKWNTIGYKYWFARFVGQCLFYALVLAGAVMQVYNTTASRLIRGVFITAAVVGTLLVLFIFQKLRFGYHGSYDAFIIEQVVRLLPVAAVFEQVTGSSKGDEKKGILSLAILIIFLHFLMEFRVMKDVCYFVAIVFRIVSKIRVFFLFFAFGVLAFTTAILHQLRGCPADSCEELDVEFPLNFWEAMSVTFFFMGGIWGPVDANFKKDDRFFHIIMILYFLFTSILLLNVLIALVNAGFNDGDVTWELEWRNIRLQYIEIAEMIACNSPEYRKRRSDIFPKEIYYVATRQEQRAYYAKYFQEESNDPVGSDGNGGSSISSESQTQLKEDVRAIQKQLEEQQRGFEKIEKQMTDMKELLEKALARS